MDHWQEAFISIPLLADVVGVKQLVRLSAYIDCVAGIMVQARQHSILRQQVPRILRH